MASPRAQRPRDRHHQPRPITSPRRPQTRASTAGFGERRTRLLLSAHIHGEISDDNTYTTPAEFEALHYRQTQPASEAVTQ